MQNEEDNPYTAPNEPGTMAEVSLKSELMEDDALLVRRGRRIYLVVAATLLLLPLITQILSGEGLNVLFLIPPGVLLVAGWRGSRQVLGLLILSAVFYCPAFLFPLVFQIGSRLSISREGILWLFLIAVAVYVAILWALVLSRSMQAFFIYQRCRFSKTNKQHKDEL